MSMRSLLLGSVSASAIYVSFSDFKTYNQTLLVVVGLHPNHMYVYNQSLYIVLRPA